MDISEILNILISLLTAITSIFTHFSINNEDKGINQKINQTIINTSYLNLEKKYNKTNYTISNNAKNRIKNFENILSNSWLQLYDSKNKENPLSFHNENFYFENNSLVFKVCGNKKRAELRFKDEWKINENKNIKIEVKLNPLDSEEFTFLQILSYDFNNNSRYYRPLLRIHWNKYYKGKKNHIWATLRLSLYKNKFKKFDLGTYNGNYVDVLIKINNKILEIYINNELKVKEKIKNWSYINYFKTGVYIQKGGCAEARFKEIAINYGKESNLQSGLRIIK